MATKTMQLSAPNYLDMSILYKWIPDESRIIRQMESEGTFCVAYFNDEVYSFARFFNLNGETCCSIDFQSHDAEDMINKITDLLEEKFSY